jgi:hypothetical protein
LVKYLVSLALCLTVLSCSEDVSHLLPRYSGAPGEVVCIVNNQLWEGEVGDIIFKYLGADQPLLPQAEPYFNLFHFDPAIANNITRQHRNLVFINVGPSAGKARVEAVKDKWASEQIVISLFAPSISSFDSLMAENSYFLIQKISEFERNRLQSKSAGQSHGIIADSLFEKQALKITVPNDCELATHKKRFMWIKRDRERNVSGTMHDITEGVFIYNYPYTSDSAFTTNSILQVRDSVLKKYVPGPLEGSYMTTEYLLPPESEIIDFKGHYAVLTRGLWKVQGAIMGGPFINLTVYDSAKQRVVTAEGFVFAPKFDKREYLREVEAMIFSVDL